MKNVKFIYVMFFVLLFVATGLLGGCSEWTDPEPVDQKTLVPSEQDPELYARYLESLRTYKSSPHLIAYARLDNAPDVITNGKNYLLAMPDSLDIISLRRSDNPSTFDIEDMKTSQAKGTKIIYYIDYTTVCRSIAKNGDVLAGLSAYLDGAIARFNNLKFDGFTIAYAGDPEGAEGLWDQALKVFVDKLTPVAGGKTGKMLMFEGNPMFVAVNYHASFDYFVLNTSAVDNVYDLSLQISHANEFSNIPLNKIIITVCPTPLSGDAVGGVLIDENNVKQDAITEAARRVISSGPIAGMGVYNVGDDYYHSEMNYKLTRQAIQIMNPSPIN